MLAKTTICFAGTHKVAVAQLKVAEVVVMVSENVAVSSKSPLRDPETSTVTTK